MLAPGVKLLCKLAISFDASLYDELPKYISPNTKERRVLDFTIEMRLTSGEIKWSTRYKGKAVGSVSATISK